VEPTEEVECLGQREVKGDKESTGHALTVDALIRKEKGVETPAVDISQSQRRLDIAWAAGLFEGERPTKQRASGASA
jgi:hypothetical protein